MILHCDMDAFYASVEERDRPELVGHPVIVGGSPEKRGVVAAANYLARRYGVHSAMPAVTAKRLCPHGIFLPSRIDHYAEVSSRIQEVFGRFTPLVEPLSLDEAFLDVTGSEQLFGSAVEIGQQIKQAVRDETRLVASVGVAPNKFLAKIASDLQKPDGFVVVESDQVQQFLDPLPVERLCGVGRQSSKIFHRLGIRTVGQLRQWPMETLTSHLGSQGEHLWQLAHGIDDRSVVPEREAKSISHETTFEQDIDDQEVLRAWLLDLTEQVAWRLRRHELRGRVVQLKVRFADFSTITRSQTLPEPTDITDELWQIADKVFCERLPAGHLPVRLLGMGVGGLDASVWISRSQRTYNAHVAGMDVASPDIQGARTEVNTWTPPRTTTPALFLLSSLLSSQERHCSVVVAVPCYSYRRSSTSVRPCDGSRLRITSDKSVRHSTTTTTLPGNSDLAVPNWIRRCQ